MRIADATISDEASSRRAFLATTGGARYAFAVVFLLVAAWFMHGAARAFDADEVSWRWIGALYNAAPAALFLIVAVVIGFGRERFTIDARHRTASLERGIGPFNWSRITALPATGVVRVDFTKKRLGSTEHWKTQTIYTVRLPGIDWFDLSSVDDRDRALDEAGRLAALLGYSVENHAEHDGIERRPAS